MKNCEGINSRRRIRAPIDLAGSCSYCNYKLTFSFPFFSFLFVTPIISCISGCMLLSSVTRGGLFALLRTWPVINTLGDSPMAVSNTESLDRLQITGCIFAGVNCAGSIKCVCVADGMSGNSRANDSYKSSPCLPQLSHTVS